MPVFSLDTNAIIAFVKAPLTSPISEKIRKAGPDVVVSTVVLQELLFGAEKSSADQRAANFKRLQRLSFPIIDYGREDAAMTGRIRAALSLSGQPIGPYDVMIAGQALARGLTVISNNLREFSRVHGLNCEDWTSLTS